MPLRVATNLLLLLSALWLEQRAERMLRLR